ncbi:MAG: hypothetical protein OEZ06_13635 [Myxococcales bacterium]|nr:hypothetical protein [Myxococcales bacterium]
MTVLQVPRIYFRGKISWDPIVTNNLTQLYDLDTSRPNFAGRTVAQYREAARLAVDNGEGNWNPHGTHRSTFFETTVTGVDRGEGVSEADALVGQPVIQTGMLVDLNPLTAVTSQLFFDRLSLGIEGGSQILAPAGYRYTARNINFGRNTGYQVIAGVASVNWQTSFAKADLRLAARGSKIIEAFSKALQKDEVLGLTVRFNAYRTTYFDSPAATDARERTLADRIAAGGFHPNPARSLVVGVVGLWCEGEPAHVPGDRFLVGGDHPLVSSAYAAVDGDSLVLDLSNSISETGFDVEKADLGTLTVTARACPPVQLGSIRYEDYARAAYEKNSGLVCLPLDAAQKAAALSADLEVSAGGTPVLSERRFHACADTPNVYLEAGDLHSVALHVLDRGKPPAVPVKLTVAEVGGPALGPVVVSTDARGKASVELKGVQKGEWDQMLLPWQDDSPPEVPAQLDPTQSAYFSVRTMPTDDEVAKLPPTWENVFAQVLRNWNALAPCMDNWLRLNDRQQCEAYAPLLKRLTSRSEFERFRYMPVTRDLTTGERTLLHRWCDAVIAKQVKAKAEARAAAAPQPQADTQADTKVPSSRKKRRIREARPE